MIFSIFANRCILFLFTFCATSLRFWSWVVLTDDLQTNVNIWCIVKACHLKIHPLHSLRHIFLQSSPLALIMIYCSWLCSPRSPSKWHFNKSRGLSVWIRVKLTSVSRKLDTITAACRLVFPLMAPVSAAASRYRRAPNTIWPQRHVHLWQVISHLTNNNSRWLQGEEESNQPNQNTNFWSQVQNWTWTCLVSSLVC